MLIIIALCIVCALGTIIAHKVYREWIELLSGILAIFAGIGLLIALVALPMNRAKYKSDIQQYHAFEQTITTARQSGASEAERTAILMQITKWNQELASARYWNDTLFDIWIPDKYAKLPLLR
ncbi:MAG: hypothetical protein WC910_10785 [Bacteroidales bacterium]|jgi:cytochrome c biogenesis protein CcdA